MIKICPKCKIEKDHSEYGKDSQKRDGLCSSCKDCMSEYRKKWRNTPERKAAAKAYAKEYFSNPENKKKHSAHMAEYFKKTRESYSARGDEWRAKPENAEKIRAYQNRADVKKATNRRVAEWAKANPEARRASLHNRRAREKEVGGKHTAADIKQLFRLQRGKCACCHVSIADGYHVDHIQPLALGGSNDKTNLQLLCQICNLKKAAKPPERWAAENGRLI